MGLFRIIQLFSLAYNLSSNNLAHLLSLNDPTIQLHKCAQLHHGTRPTNLTGVGFYPPHFFPFFFP